jgi:signal recognition particle subunit SEC65
MISRASLRPTAFLFTSNGVHLFCPKSLLVRGAAKSPSTKGREASKETWYKNRSAEEIVARQLGKTYIAKDQKSMPRMPVEILMGAYKVRRLKIQVPIAQKIMSEFELIVKKPNAHNILASMCESKDIANIFD